MADPQSAPNTAKLLPCPFCGGEPSIIDRAASPATEKSSRAYFISCYCGGYAAHAWQNGYGDTADEAKVIASTRWNTRASALPPSGVDNYEKVARILCCYEGCLREKHNSGPCDALSRAKLWPTYHEIPEILALLNAPQWQPIETAPKDGTKFMAFDSRTQTPWFVYWDGSKLHPNRPTLTHWQLLPAPPSVVSSYHGNSGGER